MGLDPASIDVPDGHWQCCLKGVLECLGKNDPMSEHCRKKWCAIFVTGQLTSLLGDPITAVRAFF